MRKLKFAAVAAALPLSARAVPAAAQKAADTLRLAFRDSVPNIDPYYNSQRTGLILSHTVQDMLVYRDPATFEIKPLLATEWKLVDDLTIDFTLRQGVKFHDGSAFSADDVVYTINTVSNPDSKVSTPSNYSWIEKAEKTGDYSVRVKLKRADPGGAGILRTRGADLAEGLSREGRSRRLCQGAGRRRPLQGHQGRAVGVRRVRAVRRLLRQPQGQARDQEDHHALIWAKPQPN